MLTTTELGALVRLIQFSWYEDPPCTIAPTSLAMVAGVTDEDWSRIGARLLLALAATGCNSGERVLLRHARRVYDEQLSKAADTSAAKSRAGKAGAQSRWQRDGTCHAPATESMAPAIPAPSLRSAFSSTLPPHRTNPAHLNQSALNQGAQGKSDEDVIAQLGDGARAILAEKVAAWKREQCLRLLQEAFARWEADGYTSVPMWKANELAAARHAEPARVEFLIGDGDAAVAQHKAQVAKNQAANVRKPNPVGLVMHGLGESIKSNGRPREVPIFLAERWHKLQSETLRVLEAQAAIAARVAAARRITTSTPNSPSHPHSGNVAGGGGA